MNGQQSLEYEGLRPKRAQYERTEAWKTVERQQQLGHARGTSRQLAMRGLILFQVIRGQRVPELARDEDVLRAEGLAIITEIFGDMFPHLHGQ